MKICSKCGTSQNDNNTLCVQCGAALGAPVDKETAYQVEKAQREKLTDFTNNADYLTVGTFSKIMIVINGLLLLGDTVLSILYGFSAIYVPVIEALLLSFMTSAPALFVNAFPKAAWNFFSLRIRFYSTDYDPHPSYIYCCNIRVFSITFTIVSAICYAVAFLG